MNTMDLIWTVVGFVLSLMIFSYLIGDNILFDLLPVCSLVFLPVTWQ